MIELNVLSNCQITKYFFVLIFGFFFTYLLVPYIINIACKLNIVDNPDGKLKLQTYKVPYLGGVVICLCFFINLVISKILGVFSFNIFWLTGLLFLMLIGLVDDLFRLSPLSKLFGQFVVSLFFLYGLLQNFDYTIIKISPLVILWFLTIINAFNLIDIMDGLACSVAILESIFFLYMAKTLLQLDIISLLICLLGPLLAFFVYNITPARIYLGDAGSLFLGGFFSLMPFLFNSKILSFNFMMVVLFILIIPILEILALILIRTYKNIPFYLGSPHHFAIYLQSKGWSKNYILIFVNFMMLLFFVNSLLFFKNYLSQAVFLFLTFILFIAWIYIAYFKPIANE